MDVFEYLPQLIVAYDSNDEFANLIHVKKSDEAKDYFCPCCGGVVKTQILKSGKEKSHFYHITEKCKKDSQLHFFINQWMFKEGNEFCVGERLYKVEHVDIGKEWDTPFGTYQPDITVYTISGEVIFFELFFANRKTEDNYFCKWSYLGNDVAEINTKEYMEKLDYNTIPYFGYLYHDGICYSRQYAKKDLYANTIAKIKNELMLKKPINHKARIEQLDYFWQKLTNNEPREVILEIISSMGYDDMVSCYEIIKRKHCTSYMKDDVLNTINQKVISDFSGSIGFENDENVYFDLKRINGRKYEVGIHLKIKTAHIVYDDLFVAKEVYLSHKDYNIFTFNFKNNILTFSEIKSQWDNMLPSIVDYLRVNYMYAVQLKNNILSLENELPEFEKDIYKVRAKNDTYTVLIKDGERFKVLLNGYKMKNPSIKELSNAVKLNLKEIEERNFVQLICSDEIYSSVLQELNSKAKVGFKFDFGYIDNSRYNKQGIYFKLFFGNKCIFEKKIEPRINEFSNSVKECKAMIKKYGRNYDIVESVVNEINGCKNNFWSAELHTDYKGCPVVIINQKLFPIRKDYLSTHVKVNLTGLKNGITETELKDNIKDAMSHVFRKMERCGYRVMEVRG